MDSKEWQANSGEQPHAASEQKSYLPQEGQAPRQRRPRFQSHGTQRQGGYQREGYQRREGGSFQRRENSYNAEQREGGYQRREGGYQREGYQRRESGYQREGYQRRESGYQRDGEYRPRTRFNSENTERRESNGGFRPYKNNSRGNNFHDSRVSHQRKYNPTKQINYEEPAYDPTKPMRLNKFLANAGICSRREADEFIQAGVITVNGNTVTELGTKITGADRVMFHDQLVRMERKVYILLNKPKDCVTTAEDTHARTTVLDIIKGACQERVYPVGRLDRNTTGVLLLTNDGELATKLTHPKFEKKKIYHATLDRELDEEHRQLLLAGVELEDGTKVTPDALEFVKEDDHTQVGIEIHSGQNRIVRRLFEKINYKVIKLDRVFFAGLTKKNLPRGKWRFLTQREVNQLQMGAFE